MRFCAGKNGGEIRRESEGERGGELVGLLGRHHAQLELLGVTHEFFDRIVSDETGAAMELYGIVSAAHRRFVREGDGERALKKCVFLGGRSRHEEDASGIAWRP